MSKERLNNYDLLRVLSAVAVIVLHVNVNWFETRAYEIELNNINYIIESLFNIVTRFCVPSFVMISGAFLLNNPKTADFKTFYKKSFIKIILPFVVILFGLTCYDFMHDVIFGGGSYRELIKKVVMGWSYNLWYMYMLVGLYLIAPIIYLIKQRLSARNFALITTVYFIWTCGSRAISNDLIPYSTGVVFAYSSYFMLGSVIYEQVYQKIRLNEVKRKKTLFVCALSAILLIVITFLIRSTGHFQRFLFDAYILFFSPTIAPYAVLVFIFFSLLKTKNNYSKLAGYTFYIYLFHTITINGIVYLVNHYLGGNVCGVEWIDVLIITTMTFIFSLLFSVAFKWMWDKILEKTKIKDFLTR